MGIRLNKDVSTLNRAGPRIELRPAFPKVPAIGMVYARGSNQCSAVPEITGPLKFGFLSGTSMTLLLPVPELLKPTIGVIGNPLWALAIPFHCQPPIKWFSNPVAPLPKRCPLPNGN